jgi:hypothetical protein
MGREANCICEWGGETARVKALLEPPELILRRDIRRRLLFSELRQVRVEGAALRFKFEGDVVALTLGATTAEKWAKAILTPPPSLAMKLDILPRSTIRTIGKIDDDALLEAVNEARTVARGKADLIVARVNTHAELKSAFKRAGESVKDGVAIWIAYRKGPGHAISESDVRSAGLATGIVDVKVASVSAQLTTLKFVKRKNPKPK